MGALTPDPVVMASRFTAEPPGRASGWPHGRTATLAMVGSDIARDLLELEARDGGEGDPGAWKRALTVWRRRMNQPIGG